MKHHLQQQVAKLVAEVAEIISRNRIDDLVSSSIVYGAMLAKVCSTSQGQPVTGVRSCAMISIRPAISREGVMAHHS
ncbi:MAG: hypothetical protein JWQ94_3476 [Tardiphaga sp.]|nr:hypothetical protein [Tardiphaga sp.]